MNARRRRGLLRILWFAALALTVACGGPRPPDTIVFTTPEALQPPRVAFDVDAIDPGARHSGDAERRQQAVLEALDQYALQPQTATRVDGTLAVEALDAATGHALLLFERANPWTEHSARVLIQHFYHLPGDERLEDIVFVGAAPPFAVSYVFSTEWWSLLEARLYNGFSQDTLPLDDPTPYIAHSADTLLAFGGVEGFPVETLQALLDAVPKPEGDQHYRPAATLLAIGLLLGEEIRHRHPRLEWMSGAEAEARYFALGRHGEVLLRPIDFVILAYQASIENGVAGYVELADIRLSE